MALLRGPDSIDVAWNAPELADEVARYRVSAAGAAPIDGGGRPAPGHRVVVLAVDTGELVPDGTEGGIAVLAPDPVMFLDHWNRPDERRPAGSSGRGCASWRKRKRS